jgi:hypothetical protein
MSNVRKLALMLAAEVGCLGDSVGIFDGHGDVGTVLHEGSVVFDAAAQSYTVTGSGENMWAARTRFSSSGNVFLAM